MVLVATGDDGGRDDGEQRGLETPCEQRARRAQIERMQPCAEESEGNKPVADEVAALAQIVVVEIPGAVPDGAKPVLEDGPQNTAGVL